MLVSLRSVWMGTGDKYLGFEVPARGFLVMIFGALLSQARGSGGAWGF